MDHNPIDPPDTAARAEPRSGSRGSVPLDRRRADSRRPGHTHPGTTTSRGATPSPSTSTYSGPSPITEADPATAGAVTDLRADHSPGPAADGHGAHRRPRRRRRHLWSALGLVLVALAILIIVLTPPEQNAEEVHESEKTGKFEGWTPNFFEDFDVDARVGTFGAIYGREWNGYSGFADTSGRGLYAPDRVLSVHDSMLDFDIHTEDGQHLVAAPLPSGYDGQTYGRFSLRFKSDNIPGYKIAFMLWPESDSWNDGEIDWPEGELAGPMSPASAQVGTLRDGEMSFDTAHRVYSPTNATDWHVATTEWTPGSVKFYWDGELVGETSVPERVPTLPMRWTLQAETNLEEAFISDDTSGHILVDWVRAWEYAPTTPED
jgi:hypothetical protein